MIRVSIWTEDIQETLAEKPWLLDKENASPEEKAFFRQNAEDIRSLHGKGIWESLKTLCEERETDLAEEEISVVHVLHYDMPEHGLSSDVLDETDVLVWWSHVANERLSDLAAERVCRYVHNGMGFIALHSASMCKPLQMLLGTSGACRWRENDHQVLWTIMPAHPIAKRIPSYIDLKQEEMYGEPFDIPTPDELVFISGFSGGEVLRSGCVWNRGLGKIFYFQPGHETDPSYFHADIRRIIRNGIRWCRKRNQVYPYIDDRMAANITAVGIYAHMSAAQNGKVMFPAEDIVY